MIVDNLQLAESLDKDQEMWVEVDFDDWEKCTRFWVTKEGAAKIIAHLQRTFELGEK